ncbi:MAG: hypothetical protein AAF386_12515 [Pseudomonadota bacterium]
MNDGVQGKIVELKAELMAVKRLFRDGLEALSRAEMLQSELQEIAKSDSLASLPLCDTPATTHRTERRMGPIPKIDRDPELRAFILARVDRLTYPEMADEVAAHFPEDRQVSKSTIHKWYARQQRFD